MSDTQQELNTDRHPHHYYCYYCFIVSDLERDDRDKESCFPPQCTDWVIEADEEKRPCAAWHSGPKDRAAQGCP